VYLTKNNIHIMYTSCLSNRRRFTIDKHVCTFFTQEEGVIQCLTVGIESLMASTSFLGYS
jgi:hypothetical protein